MSPERANAIYDILAEYAGAPEHGRVSFVYHAEEGRSPMEHRFCGHLGFGGKFRMNAGRIYVDYDPEDRTAERDAIVKATNEALAALDGDK